jgi:hypothetical protein
MIAKQTELYKRRKDIKNKIRPIKLEDYHKKYLWNFASKNKGKIIKLLSIVFSLAIVELLSIYLINASITDQIYFAIQSDTLKTVISIVIAGVVLYLVLNYLAIRNERELVIDLINNMRRDLFSAYLKNKTKNSNELNSSFLAKITYHLPLLSLGMDRFFFGLVRWIVSLFVILVVGLTLDIVQIVLIISAILIGVLAGLVAYFVSKHFVAKEVASYSMVIKHVSNSLYELPYIRNQKKEIETIDELNNRVEIDTYFRIRRDLWLRYFDKVILAIVFLIYLSVIVLVFSFPALTELFYNPGEIIITGIVYLYIGRLIYESVIVGLYYLPFKLGVFLCVPKKKVSFLKGNLSWNKISFRTNKTKLFEDGNYYKELKLNFGKSNYLFYGEKNIGKTCLANVLNGKPSFNPNGWIVVLDKDRIPLKYFADQQKTYFFDNKFNSQVSVGKFLFKKDISKITRKDFETINKIIEKYPNIFDKIISGKRSLGQPVTDFSDDIETTFALQVLHCVINKIEFIVIDNFWSDLNYEDINKCIKIMDEEIKLKTIVIFSRSDNNLLKYNKKYEIKKEEIKEVS